MATSTRATSRARSRPSTEDHVMVENIIRPQSRRRVDGPKYRAMRRAPLAVVPRRALGLTVADALAALIPRLPTVLFPGVSPGANQTWWLSYVRPCTWSTPGSGPYSRTMSAVDRGIRSA
jgi:Family of unknown function (DUF6958)